MWTVTNSDDFDFLDTPAETAGDGSDWTVAVPLAIEAVRGELLDWAAKTLRQRVPQAAAYPGNKGQVQCRLDLDRHLKQVLAVPLPSLAVHLTEYRAWALHAVWLPRGSPPETLDAGAAVLAEALIRYVPAPAVARWAAQLTTSLGSSDSNAVRLIAQRCATI